MSRRTKLSITALFLLLLGIPTTYVAFTWSPDNALRFRMDYVAPSSKEDPEADRRVRVSIENTTAAPIHFYGAVTQRESTLSVLPEPRPSKIIVVRDLLSGVVVPQLLQRDTPFDATSRIAVPAFLMLDAAVGEPLIIPAHSTVLVPAILPGDLVDASPPCDIFVHYHWETRTRVAVRNMTQWLRKHSPSWAGRHIPQLSHRQDITPLQRITE